MKRADRKIKIGSVKMKRLFAIIALILGTVCAYAQPSITVQVPSAVTLDEQFSLSFVVEGEKSDDFNWPGSQDFDILWGPQVGSSSSVTIINGKRNKTVSSSYTYVLMPKREGSFVLPACTVKVKGKTYSSAQTPIKVVKGSGSGAASSGSSSAQGTGSVSGEDLFIRLTVDKRNVVLGEPITATLKLYSKVNIGGFEDVRFPSFEGFWSQVEYNPTNIEFRRESLGEEVYNVATLRTYKIIPQKIGDLTIEPSEMVCLVQVRNRANSSGSLFDSFFQNDYNTIRKRVRSKGVTIAVNDLPSPKPASFCGGVGKFNMAVQLSRDSLRTHDAASVLVKVKGEGNLNLVEAPKIKFPADFEVYDVKSTDENGMRIFEYPFIPRSYGDYQIGPVEFSYYDVTTKSYKTISAQALSLNVRKSEVTEESKPAVPFVGAAGKAVKNLGEDIRYISVKSGNLKPSGQLFVCSPLFFCLCALVLLAAVLTVILSTRLRARRADGAVVRRRGASKAARKKLSLSANYMKQGLSGAFYEELHKALLGFVADRLTMDISQLDKDNIQSALSGAGVDDALVAKYLGLLDACEMARFSPSSHGDSMNSLYENALEVISGIEDSMDKKHKIAGKVLPVMLALLSLGSLSTQLSAQPSSEWDSAVAAYAASDYQGAFDIWSSIEQSGLASAELYYNMGCASYKMSNMASSVLYFERALKLDPSYEDARHNLEYVSQFLQDRIDAVPEFFLANWFSSLENKLSSNTWAVLSLLWWIVLSAGVVAFVLARGRKLKVAGFIGAIVAAVLFALSLTCSISLKNKAMDDTSAIVMASFTVVKSSPDDMSGTELFVLHEGTKTRILQDLGEWCNIELADGRRGWMKKSSLENI